MYISCNIWCPVFYLVALTTKALITELTLKP